MRGRDLVGSTRSADRPASPVRSRASGGCCCRGSRADTSGRTSILGLFPCWATSASRSCSGLGGRGHSADGGFILRRVAWLSQAKTRPEARPARTYSGAAQTGGCTFHRIAPAWGAAATATWAGGTWAALCWAEAHRVHCLLPRAHEKGCLNDLQVQVEWGAQCVAA